MGYVLLVPSVAADEPPSSEELESLEEVSDELFPRRATMSALWRSITSSKKKLHAHRSILRAMCLYLPNQLLVISHMELLMPSIMPCTAGASG